MIQLCHSVFTSRELYPQIHRIPEVILLKMTILSRRKLSCPKQRWGSPGRHMHKPSPNVVALSNESSLLLTHIRSINWPNAPTIVYHHDGSQT